MNRADLPGGRPQADSCHHLVRPAREQPQHPPGVAVIGRLAKNLAACDDGGIGAQHDDLAVAECDFPRALRAWLLASRTFEQFEGARRLLRSEAADVVGRRFAGLRALVEIDRQHLEREAGRGEQLGAPRRC
jgi:hypothetical protein